MADTRIDTAKLRAHASDGWGDECLLPKTTVLHMAQELDALRAAALDSARIDFTVNAKTTWYPGRAADGKQGILCFSYMGRRAEATGANIREAIDAAMVIAGVEAAC